MLEDDKWKQKASCKGSDLNDFFPVRIGKNNSEKVYSIMNLCEKCKVNAECLYDAIWNDSVGIWGRTTYRQRLTFFRKHLNSKRSNLTLDKCRQFISHLSSNNILPNRKSVNSDIQN